MTHKGHFSRDWTLLKLSRSWQPPAIAEDVIGKVLDTGSESTRREVLAAVEERGAEEGQKFLARMPEGTETPAILESFLLLAGIPCETEEGPKGAVVRIQKEEEGTLLGLTPATGIPFLRGFICSLPGGPEVGETETEIRVLLSPPGESKDSAAPE